MSAPFAQITQGPATATGQNPNKQALILDRLNNITESVGDGGQAQALQTALLVLTAQTALTTITTAQNLINLALNAAVLNKQNRTLLISGSLIYTTPGTTTPAASLALVLGGVTLCTITLATMSATASTNMPINFWFELTIASTGSSGTVESHGQVNANLFLVRSHGIDIHQRPRQFKYIHKIVGMERPRSAARSSIALHPFPD